MNNWVPFLYANVLKAVCFKKILFDEMHATCRKNTRF